MRDVRKVDPVEYHTDAPKVIEGADIYRTLCPISKFTGHPESPFKLLGKLTGANAQLLNSVLAELPTIASDSRLSDSDRADYLASRLCTGTPAENAEVANWILRDLDNIIPKPSQEVPKPSETISFADDGVNSNAE